jgi:hypothetical protein
MASMLAMRLTSTHRDAFFRHRNASKIIGVVDKRKKSEISLRNVRYSSTQLYHLAIISPVF